MRKFVFILSAIVFFSSCKNLVPYTDSMKRSHNWTTDQVKKIQFYVSDPIVLRRELSGSSTEIVEGKIKMENGKKIDEIYIRSGTPGVVTSIPNESKMLVSFEMGDDHSLSFGVNPNNGEKYVLLASEWSNGAGKVHYGGKQYYTNPGSKFAYLLVDLRKVNKMDVRQHVAKGRKIK